MSRRLEAAEYGTSLYEGIVLSSKCGQQKHFTFLQHCFTLHYLPLERFFDKVGGWCLGFFEGVGPAW